MAMVLSRVYLGNKTIPILYIFNIYHNYRQFSTWWISHYRKNKYISMDDDVPLEADQLPPGSVPLWVDVPRHTSHLDIVRAMSELQEISGHSVTVLWWGAKDTSAATHCEDLGWKYLDWNQMYGCEDEVIIAIDCLEPEPITRPHNLLVMVTTPGEE